MKLEIGRKAPTFMAQTLTGETIYLKDFANKKVLLKFYRFATCPVCNLHLREFLKKHEELSKAGIEVVVVYHSPKWRLEQNMQQQLPFPIIADPDKKLFKLYGVKNSLAGMFSFAVWRDYALALAAGFSAGMLSHDGGISGHPADFLVDEKGILRHAHYGVDYADSLTVSQALDVARKLELIQPENLVQAAFA